MAPTTHDGAARPRILVTIPIFAEVLARLHQHFEVDAPCGTAESIDWTPTALAARAQGVAGLLVAGAPRIDAALLAACPDLRAVCSMAVGYNNIDLPACTACGVLVSNALLDTPLPQADAQLAQVLHEHARERLAALSARTELGQALRAWITGQLHAHLPTRAQAARVLGLTERTLARRLQAQGLSFSGLLDEARREAALQALAHTQRPLAEIGQALGYAEPSVFNRAVRRWTGSTPGAWRLAQQVRWSS